jgi:hypothetical protein
VGPVAKCGPPEVSVLAERGPAEVSALAECGLEEVGVPAEHLRDEVVGAFWEDKPGKIIPMSHTMDPESFREGMDILCGVWGVKDTQTIRRITLNIPTADVIMFASGTAVFLVHHLSLSKLSVAF